jgi:hypothetical protein
MHLCVWARRSFTDATSCGSISHSFGSYLSGVVSLYFVGVACKRFLLARTSDTEQPERSKQADA